MRRAPHQVALASERLQGSRFSAPIMALRYMALRYTDVGGGELRGGSRPWKLASLIAHPT
jgi:hypothetical protein